MTRREGLVRGGSAPKFGFRRGRVHPLGVQCQGPTNADIDRDNQMVFVVSLS